MTGDAGAGAWAAVFAGYDDAALALAADAGTVRRAVKLQASTSVAWQTRGDDAGEVRVGELVVRLDGGGPRTARCPCPVTGVCVHVLLASRWVRDGMVADAADPLAELLGLDPLALCRSAGIAAARVAAASLAAASLAEASLPADLPAEGTPAAGTRVTVSGRQVEISWPGAAHPVVYVAGGGLDGMLPPARRSALHLEALCRVILDAGRTWTWPPGVAEHVSALHRPRTLTTEQSDAVDAVAATVTSTAGAGVAHAGVEAADRLTAAAQAARAAGLVVLARRTRETAALVDGYARHRTDVTERSVGVALAACLALCEALRRSTGDDLDALVGQVRREFAATDTLELLPLGVRTWQSTSGARGATLTVWDVAAAELRSVTAARASGADRGFVVGWDAPMFWGRTVESVCAGPFRLHSPRLAADGSLAATGGPVLSREPSAGVDVEALDAVAVGRWSELHGRQLGSARLDDTRLRCVLLRPHQVGAVRIDEARQHLVWEVLDADGSVLVLRQRVTPGQRRRVDALLELPVAHVELVLVDAIVDEGELLLEPVSVVVRVAEVPRLLALDLAPPDAYHPAARSPKERQDRLDAVQAAHAALERHRQERRAVGSAVQRLCGGVSEVVDQVLATGRRRLSTGQRATLTAQAAVARDCALTSVASSIDAMLADGDVPVTAVLRTRFVLDRVAALPGSRAGGDLER